MKEAMKKNLTDKQQQELGVLVTFLERTRDGKYAAIEETSIQYARTEATRDDTCSEENYFYGLH